MKQASEHELMKLPVKAAKPFLLPIYRTFQWGFVYHGLLYTPSPGRDAGRAFSTELYGELCYSSFTKVIPVGSVKNLNLPNSALCWQNVYCALGRVLFFTWFI